MSQEILYTSARQGLKPGSRGFCTVVSTQGMAKNLASRLESLSGYRHAYPVHDPRAKLNPVAYSHLLLSLGGRPFHVLSRVCDAGFDYTKRSNKLAHHVALQPKEIAAVPGGPAWVMSDDTFCETTWDENTRILPAGRVPRAGDYPSRICQTWAQLSGDAGWAGVLAESALVKRVRPVSVIFKAGTDTLRLVLEALSLLPPENRWKVTFSTYFTKLPAGVDCQWRFLLDDSPEAKVIRRDPHASVIDLCGALAPAKGGELVEVAKRGSSARTSRAPNLVSAPKHPGTLVPPPTVADVPPPYEDEEADEYAIPRPALSPAKPPVSAPPASPSAPALGVFRKRKKSILMPVAMGLCGVIVGGAIVAGVMISLRPSVDQKKEVALNDPAAAAEAAAKEAAAKEAAADKAAADKAAADKAAADKVAADEKAAADKAAADKVAADKAAADKAAADKMAADKAAADKKAAAQKTPFSDILSRNCLLPLPPRAFPLDEVRKPVELAKLFVGPEQKCGLEIIGNIEVHGEEKKRFYTEPKDNSPEPRSWDVLYTSGSGAARTSLIGTFTLADQALSFKWFESAKDTAHPAKFQYCLLKIGVDGKSQACILSRPLQTDPLKLDLDAKDSLTEIPFGSEDIPDTRYLRLDLQLEGFPEHKLSNASGRTVIVGDPKEENICEIKIPDGDGDDRMDDFLTIQLGFKYDKSSVRYGLQREAKMKLLEYMDFAPLMMTEVKDPSEKLVLLTAEVAKMTRRECSASKVETYLKQRKNLQEMIHKKERGLEPLQEQIKGIQKQRSDIQGKIDAIEKKLNAIQNEINQAVPPGANEAAAAAMKKNLEGQMAPKRNPLLNGKQALQLRLEALRLGLQELEKKESRDRTPLDSDRKRLQDLDFNVRYRETNRKRLEKRDKLVKTIKDEGRIDFRVYAMIEGKEIDVMRSDGFTKKTTK